MKRKATILITGVLAGVMLMTGCSSSNNASNEYVSVGGYKEIEVADIQEPGEVTDEDVDNYIEGIRNQNATTEEITDREVQSGDVVNIDYIGKMDGEEFDGGSSAGYSLEIGSGSFIPGFEDSIIGHMPGETFDWDGSFPDPYTGNPDFSGKPVTFTITVNYINGETIVPELTDEFVQSVSDESKTVKEYRAEIKKMLSENSTTDYDMQLQEAAWQAVLEKAEIKGYPDGEVEQLKSQLVEQYKTAAKDAGMEVEDFLQQFYGMSEEDFNKQAEEAAKESIKQRIIADAIAEQEKLIPKDDELEKEYEALAKEYGYADVDALKEAADEETLKDIVISNRVKKFLAEHAIQVKE